MPVRALKLLIVLTIAAGALRFALSIGGAPNAMVKFVSMTPIVFAGALYCAVACDTWKQRLKAAYLLILPYMIVEVSTLGYSLLTGKQTIFSASEYSLQTSLPV